MVDMDCAYVPDNAEAGGGLMVAVIQLAIALDQRQEASCLTALAGRVRLHE